MEESQWVVDREALKSNNFVMLDESEGRESLTKKVPGRRSFGKFNTSVEVSVLCFAFGFVSLTEFKE